MRHAGGYSYDEDYDLDKCVICGAKMSNEDEPTCSLECEEKREEIKKRNKTNDVPTTKMEKEKRIKEILTFLRNQGYTSLDLVDELESLIADKMQEDKRQ